MQHLAAQGIFVPARQEAVPAQAKFEQRSTAENGKHFCFKLVISGQSERGSRKVSVP
jgi:hypothetical protein